MSEAAERRALVRYSCAMHTAGWVANHDGNLSVRIGPDRIVCTPTSFSKADVDADSLVVVDDSGRKLSGRQRPFSELSLHRAVYRARSKVRAVVHAHPPFATAFGAAGKPLPHPFLPEAVVSLGPEVPLVPLAAPGAAAVSTLEPFIRRCDAVIIAGNGVLSWGPSLELAYLRLELVEHLCRIAHAAAALGGPRPLPVEMVQTLLAKRRKGGLAAPDEVSPAARGASGSGGPTVERAAARALAGVPGADPRLAAQLAEQIARAMQR